jgi:Flp pilus assembly protein TadG
MRNEHVGQAICRRTQVRGLGDRRQRGEGLVEQALVLTLLLSVLFGIIDCGRMLYTYHFVANAAREATRWASVRSTTTILPGGPADANNVQTYVANVSGMGLDKNQITATPTWDVPPNANPSCPGNRPGCIVQVQVQYKYHFFMPLLPSWLVTMTSTSRMVISQ